MTTSTANSVNVTHGAYSENVSLVGETVGSIRRLLRDVANVPSDAKAILNGEIVGNDTILRNGDVLEFVKVVGQKGGLPDFWSENEVVALFGAATVKRMQKAGLVFAPNSTISVEEVRAWVDWLVVQGSRPPAPLPFTVSIEKEELIYRGKVYQCDHILALILTCLLDANGEIRSTADMKRRYPRALGDERLDRVIKRQIGNHPSGIGEMVESVKTKGYRIVVETRE